LNSIIQILPEHLANKIAAGEVVERPASVVKELVENALDADADSIELHIEQGGKQLIQVVDNGSGMSEDDLQLAFERHATSKIRDEADLDRIETLGFRGEALPSIASVAQIEIKSRHKTSDSTYMLRISGGQKQPLKRIAGNPGTSISVRNLFFNTPARRQFLRSDSAEAQRIILTMKQFTLAYPHISFKIMFDGREVLVYPAQDAGDRVQEIFGPEVFKALIKVDSSLGGAVLRGFISRPDTVRKARGNQYLFINGRPVQNKALNHAVFQAYGHSIMPGEYPYYVLFLEYDPGLIDVNVHPTKMEVRFANEQSIYHFFMHAVQTALNKESVIPAFSSATAGGSIIRNTISEMDKPREIMQELVSRKRDMARFSGSQLSLTYFQPAPAADAGKPAVIQKEPDLVEKQVLKPTTEVNFWQLHHRYIVTEIRSGLVFIDQHVAHERILYEKITRILSEGERSYSQKLLFPHKMTLSPDDFAVFRDISEALTRFGFSITVFSGTSIVIEAMPVDVKIGRESQILLDIIDYYRNHPLQGFNHLEKVSAAYACKNAVKSGEVLTAGEMQTLVDQLFACESPFFCPHGRPVIVTFEMEELDKKFKRIPS